ncbi:NUDIX domain-containing protein [bacterium]|nr:NUDIX domain-containing protein [bacterium]
MARKSGIKLTVVVVVMTISEGVLKTLLVRHDDNHWSLPGGLPNNDEPLTKAAERIVLETAGIDMEYLEQLFTFGDYVPDTGARVIEVAYHGLVPSALLRIDKLANRQTISWFTEQDQPKLIDNHQEVVSVARQRLRGKLAYTAVGFELLPDKFTLADLQNLYEVILGKELDKRNFRKKINDLGILEPTGEERTSRKGRGRPASLYRFKSEVFHTIETKGDIFPF